MLPKVGSAHAHSERNVDQKPPEEIRAVQAHGFPPVSVPVGPFPLVVSAAAISGQMRAVV
jgi:hypothetical protein